MSSPAQPNPPAQPAQPEAESSRWADRGWYLALEYGVLARDRFLRRLPTLRQQGRFKELLEPGGKILYRNLFRAGQVKEAWEALTALQPWKDRVTCYLKGEEVPLKEVHEVLWCAGFLTEDSPCRGGKPDDKARRLGCLGARVLVTPRDWERRDPKERHLWTFASIDEDGRVLFDMEEIAEFVGGRGRNALCPVSPAADPLGFAAKFTPVTVRELGWQLAADLEPELRERLGDALSAEQGFVLPRGETLEEHATFELRRKRGKVVLVLLDGDDTPVGTKLALDERIEALVHEGVLLRAIRVGESYVRREGGHYDLEQRFVLSARLHLGPADRPQVFRGYRLETVPRATPQYDAWVARLVESLS